MELWLGSINLGLLYAFMAIGVFITFRIQHFADITVDGSFTTGAATAAVLIIAGINPLIALVAAFIAGGLSGTVTGLIQTKLGVNSLLAGILVMIALYSINLHIMERSNIPLLDQKTINSMIEGINPGINPEIWLALVLLGMIVLTWAGLSYFFRTDLGLTIRTTGDNTVMTSATGIDVDKIKILSVAVANGLVGLSGGLVAQYQGFADIGMGIGTVVIGLASVIVGEAILKKNTIGIKILSAIIGSIIFRFMIAFALYIGMNPIDLKLLTALFVLVAIIISKYISGKKSFLDGFTGRLYKIIHGFRVLRWSAIALILLTCAGLGYYYFHHIRGLDRSMPKIGLALINQDGYVKVTLRGFLQEMEKLGWHDGVNCRIILSDANNDLPTLNTIAAKYLMDSVNVIVTFGTPATQAIIGKIKHIPVVFSSIANPYVIGAGKTPTDHLPNVTGIYGNINMNKIMEIVKKQFPNRRLRIGTIMDQAHANSVYNVGELKKAIAQYPEMESIRAIVSGSSEVHQVMTSVISKRIDLIIQPPDNTVFSAFDAVVAAARPHKIPIILSDHERLIDGGFMSYGYDYFVDGIKTARMVDQIMHGTDPKDIPFDEEFYQQVLRINLKIAKELGIKVLQELLDQADRIIDENGHYLPGKNQPSESGLDQKRVVLFMFNEQQTMIDAMQGIKDVLKDYPVLLEVKSAQNEYSIAKSVADEIIRSKFDYIITISTPALQIMAGANKTIPHIFGCVTDPYKMKLAVDTVNHRANITGVVTLQPVEATLRIMREIFPQAKTIGLIWNPAEACSETCTGKARQAAAHYGFHLLERNVINTSEVNEALNSLISEGIDIFFTSGDNTVQMASSMISAKLQSKKIPYFTNTPTNVTEGAFMSLGADYYMVGQETAKKAIKVMNGTNPKDIPLTEFVPVLLRINHRLVEDYHLTIPKAILDKESQ